MHMLGIIPAKAEEHKWRKDLYMLKGQGVRRIDIQKMLGPELARMKISKPQMIVWYVVSQGSNLIRQLMKMTKEDREQELWRIVKQLNGEYRQNVPIQ